jgi:hypothetical protein
MFWCLEFYRFNPDGTRAGGDKVTDGSPSLELAMTKAKSILRDNTFSWGKPNLCLVKGQDGSIVREVVADA